MDYSSSYQYSGNVPPEAGAAAFALAGGMFLFVMFLVPILNIAGIVFGIILWIDIAKRLGKSAVFGVLAALIPIIFMPYLAFSKSDTPAQ